MSGVEGPFEGLSFRAGDWVEVRSKEEILSTLDANGQLQNMPFMPQMFEYCGKRMRVVSSAHKTCDTIKWTGGRSVESAVHLEGVRCTTPCLKGSPHSRTPGLSTREAVECCTF